MNKKKLFCFGIGKVAFQLSLKLLDKGWSVHGTCRTEERKKFLENEGLKVVKFFPDKKIPYITDELDNSTHILVSIPPDSNGCLVVRFYEREISNLLNRVWLGYISSTSVYGHHGERWVDELTKPTPGTKMGMHRLISENQWKSISEKNSINLQIFRSGGIYSSKTNQIEKFKNSSIEKPIIRDNIKFNRIHQDDLVGVILSAFKKDDESNIFNVVDDKPASMWEQAQFVCKELSIPLPNNIQLNRAILTEKQKEFYKEMKLVKNDLIKKKLGYKLLYPSYKEGFKAILGI
ncbi:MAG: hypothetical protein CFH01_00636 [Alphaproteobacteria bacterium MarineAlpha2_Bin1]|nr:MAG: hypothetical protein CFH01_00636 [Alphaproteobacteria bacterium MarineAlpha2_Bin1]